MVAFPVSSWRTWPAGPLVTGRSLLRFGLGSFRRAVRRRTQNDLCAGRHTRVCEFGYGSPSSSTTPRGEPSEAIQSRCAHCGSQRQHPCCCLRPKWVRNKHRFRKRIGRKSKCRMHERSAAGNGNWCHGGHDFDSSNGRHGLAPRARSLPGQHRRCAGLRKVGQCKRRYWLPSGQGRHLGFQA
ncbi:unannotated protein [freshwater metagenome]|uniref:Unannotated protein n=1 Tax=freshwater metagenome TaxID=449393 RepID=A0A6J7IY66_9ZZZZ